MERRGGCWTASCGWYWDNSRQKRGRKSLRAARPRWVRLAAAWLQFYSRTRPENNLRAHSVAPVSKLASAKIACCSNGAVSNTPARVLPNRIQNRSYRTGPKVGPQFISQVVHLTCIKLLVKIRSRRRGRDNDGGDGGAMILED